MRTNKRVMNVSEAKLTLPKTSTEKIGYIRTVKHFTSLTVNTANVTSICVEVDVMEAKGLEKCLHVSLSNHFIELVGADFVAWTQQAHGGGPNVHLTLFDSYDSTHLNISNFATSFKTINLLESRCPAFELDLTYLERVATAIKHMTSYFQGLFAMGVPDTSAIPIIPKPSAPVAAVVQRQLAKRNSPTKQKPCEEPRRPCRCFNLTSAVPAFDPKDKGLFILQNPRDSTTFPRTSPLCPSFICQ